MRTAYAEIDLAALRFNIHGICQKVAPAKVMAVVKANAYGHGAVAVANASLRAGATYLGVARIEEAIELRENGITAPLLVLGGILPEQIDAFLNYNIEITLYSWSMAALVAERYKRLKPAARIHVKIDTGMGRVGVPWQEATALIEKIIQLPQIELVGVCTHFATSDEADKTFARLQLRRFNQVLGQLKRKQITIPFIHAANSGAILDLPATYFNMVRPGIMMYGWYPSGETSESIPIKPVMTFKTKVLYVKNIAAGESVSYGRQFITSKPTRIATLAVGYGDGYNRLLTNQGTVLIRGEKYPVVGRVCMDLIHADIASNQEIQPGDEVVLFGRQGAEEVSVYEICEKLHTIPYEVCCWVARRVPRVYVDQNLGGS